MWQCITLVFSGSNKTHNECMVLRKRIKELKETVEKLKLENRQVVFSVLTKIVRNNCKSAEDIKQIATVSKKLHEKTDQVDDQLELTEDDLLLVYGDKSNPFKDASFNVNELRNVGVETFIDELEFRADILVKENRRIKVKLIQERFEFQSKYKDVMIEFKDLELKHEKLKRKTSIFQLDSIDEISKLKSENKHLKSKNRELEKENNTLLSEIKDLKIDLKNYQLKVSKHKNLKLKLNKDETDFSSV